MQCSRKPTCWVSGRCHYQTVVSQCGQSFQSETQNFTRFERVSGVYSVKSSSVTEDKHLFVLNRHNVKTYNAFMTVQYLPLGTISIYWYCSGILKSTNNDQETEAESCWRNWEKLLAQPDQTTQSLIISHKTSKHTNSMRVCDYSSVGCFPTYSLWMRWCWNMKPLKLFNCIIKDECHFSISRHPYTQKFPRGRPHIESRLMSNLWFLTCRVMILYLKPGL